MSRWELRLNHEDDARIVLEAESGDGAVREFNAAHPGVPVLSWRRVLRTCPVTPLPLPTTNAETREAVQE